MSIRRISAAVNVYVLAICVLAALALCLCCALLIPGFASHPLTKIADGMPRASALSRVDFPGVDEGFIEEGEGVSPFADELPAITQLDPALREAMQAAASAAIADGVDFVVTSGWRSAAYQQWLLDAAVHEYGSLEEASKFVLPPEKSAHVTGNAVDIGRTDANSWLSQYGADYGLRQIYANEMWHFELATSPGGECPTQLAHAGIG
jgi:D-alanyl-D-alanine carboxypeptidase